VLRREVKAGDGTAILVLLYHWWDPLQVPELWSDCTGPCSCRKVLEARTGQSGWWGGDCLLARRPEKRYP
jgi:hypothetical protein